MNTDVRRSPEEIISVSICVHLWFALRGAAILNAELMKAQGYLD